MNQQLCKISLVLLTLVSSCRSLNQSSLESKGQEGNISLSIGQEIYAQTESSSPLEFSFDITRPTKLIIYLGIANVTVDSNGVPLPLAKPPQVTLTESSKPNSAVVSGDMILYTRSGELGGYYTASIQTEVKPGRYELAVDAGGQFSAQKKALYFVSSKEFIEHPSPAASGLSDDQIQFSIVAPQKEHALTFENKFDGLVDLSLFAEVFLPSNKILDFENSANCGKCIIEVSLKVNNQPISYDIPATDGFSDKWSYILKPGQYPLRVSLKNFPDDALVNVALSGPSSAQSPIPRLGIQSGQAKGMISQGLFEGKEFGFEFESIESKESQPIHFFNSTKLVLNNAVEPKFPKSITFKLLGPDNLSRLAKSITVTERNESITFNTPIAPGIYRFVADGKFAAKNVYIMSGLTMPQSYPLPSGGEPLSNFSDAEPLTAQPPANYFADTSIPGQPYTSQSTAVRLAMKSVLEAMELTRSTWHVTVAKGVTKGPRNVIDAKTIESCLGNVAQHWSDIQIHYYCQHGQGRACYTPRAATLGRQGAYNECKGDKSFQWIESTQGEVFQYIMFSQTYAFDIADQQRVINAFYRVTNPNDRAECTAKRPRRAIDPSDGSHCLANKIFTEPLRGIGR